MIFSPRNEYRSENHSDGITLLLYWPRTMDSKVTVPFRFIPVVGDQILAIVHGI